VSISACLLVCWSHLAKTLSEDEVRVTARRLGTHASASRGSAVRFRDGITRRIEDTSTLAGTRAIAPRTVRMGAWRFGDCVDGNRHWNLRASPLVGITCLAETVTTNLGLSGLLMDRVQRTLPPLIVFPDRNPTRMRRQRHCEIATHRSKPISVVRHPPITSLAEMQIVKFPQNNLRGRFTRRAMATHREKHE
jgi:hypothetical protein